MCIIEIELKNVVSYVQFARVSVAVHITSPELMSRSLLFQQM